jgi:hypothetical protein
LQAAAANADEFLATADGHGMDEMGYP